MRSLEQLDRAMRARNTRAVALATVLGAVAAAPIGVAWGLSPVVASSFIALAALAAAVAWLAPGMASDWLPWVLLTAAVSTAVFTALPDRQLRGAHLIVLSAIAVSGVLLPPVQVALFSILSVGAELVLFVAIGGVPQLPASPLVPAAAGIALSVVVATAAALGASGIRRALRARIGCESRARDAEVRSEENASAFRLLAACTSDLVFLVGADGRVLYASPSAERLFGAGTAAIQGRPFVERVVDADREAARKMSEQAMRGATARGNLRVKLPCGGIRTYDAAFDASTSGDLRVVAVSARDVTEQLLLAQQLQQAQKLEAVGQLARGVAHDVNNLLAVVQSGAALARESLPAGHPAHADLADVAEAADRGAALARQLLAFTRPEGQGPRRADVGAVLGQLARFIPRLMGQGIRVRVSEEREIGEVPVSPTELEQVILNLAINARDAMPAGGWIRVEARRLPCDEVGPPGSPPGDRLEIAVRDEGTGMTDEVKRHLFEPFFTTKEPGRGSGLGLATTLGIVEGAGGTIEVESAPGRGSTFRVLLPALPPAGWARAGASSPPLAATRRSRILIVDHDPALVALLSRLLAARDHEVATAASAMEARQQAASFPGAVDVVVTGLDLGPDQGVAVMGEVRRTSPQARAVLVTGEVRHDDDVGHLLEAGVELVHRPVTAEALAEVVERAASRAPVPRTTALA